VCGVAVLLHPSIQVMGACAKGGCWGACSAGCGRYYAAVLGIPQCQVVGMKLLAACCSGYVRLHMYEQRMRVLSVGGAGGASASVRGWSGMLCCRRGSAALHVSPP
jgi:hypothetical protein